MNTSPVRQVSEMREAPNEEMIQNVPVQELPSIIGELGRLQAIAYARLVHQDKGLPKAHGNLLTLPQVAERLNLPPSRIYELARRHGGLPVIKIGKYLRVLPSELDTWITRQNE